MFKEYYKQANDDIRSNRELIDNIFTVAEKKKRPVSAVVYKYGMAVAALLVVAVSVYYLPKIEEYSGVKEQELVQSDVDKNNPSVNVMSETDSSENENIESVAQNQPEVKQSNEVTKDDVKKSMASKSSERIVVERIVDYTKTTEEPMKDEESLDTVASGNMARSTNEGAVMAAMPMMYNATNDENTETVIWSNEQYKNYLGIDIEESIKLPPDLKNTTAKGVYIVMKDGEVENDTASYCFSSGERTAIVETSKKNKKPYEDGVGVSTEEVNSCSVQYRELSTDEYEAYLESDGVYFRIYSYGINKDELREMVESVTQP